MKIALFVICLVLFILFIPIKVRGKINYNIFLNSGYVSLFFYKIKILVARFKIKIFKIEVWPLNKKPISLYFKDLKNQSTFSDMFFANLLGVIKVKNFKIISNFGAQNDYLTSSLISGFLKIISGVVFCLFKNNFNSAKSIQNFTSYNQTKFLVAATVVIRLNLFYVILALIKSVILYQGKRKVLRNGN